MHGAILFGTFILMTIMCFSINE